MVRYLLLEFATCEAEISSSSCGLRCDGLTSGSVAVFKTLYLLSGSTLHMNTMAAPVIDRFEWLTFTVLSFEQPAQI